MAEPPFPPQITLSSTHHTPPFRVCALWLGRSPESFYKLYTGLGAALFAVRYFTYRRRRQHYYLFDFCCKHSDIYRICDA